MISRPTTAWHYECMKATFGIAPRIWSLGGGGDYMISAFQGVKFWDVFMMI